MGNPVWGTDAWERKKEANRKYKDRVKEAKARDKARKEQVAKERLAARVRRAVAARLDETEKTLLAAQSALKKEKDTQWKLNIPSYTGERLSHPTFHNIRSDIHSLLLLGVLELMTLPPPLPPPSVRLHFKLR